MKLLLVRHGQTDWNTAMRTQGHTDIPLNALGKAQSESLAKRLESYDIKAVYSSPLLRARQTAEPAAKRLGLDVIAEPLMIERCFGAWEGIAFEQLKRLYPDDVKQWRVDPMGYTPPEAESLTHVLDRCRRMLESFDALYARDDSVIVVGHSVPLRLMIADTINLPYNMLHAISLDNTALTLLQTRPPILIRLNDISHLESQV